MKKLNLLLFTIMAWGCGQQGQENQKAIIEETPIKELVSKNEVIELSLNDFEIKDDSTKSYQSVKEEIEKLRTNLLAQELSTDSLSQLFKTSLLNKIIPFWEGTKWSFEGHTSTPQKGEIACGYFISTTLKHAGINVNRYRLAQQSPINEAKSLACDINLLTVNGYTTEENINTIKQQLKDGIHFIGFSSMHVGFLLKENDQLYLIHSNFYDNEGVIIERAESSLVFGTTLEFHIAELSTNEALLKHWVYGTEIRVVS